MDVSSSDDPVVVVTADTHVGPSLKRLREYCRREYLEDFDAFVTQESSAPHPTVALLDSIGDLYGGDESALKGTGGRLVPEEPGRVAGHRECRRPAGRHGSRRRRRGGDLPWNAECRRHL